MQNKTTAIIAVLCLLLSAPLYAGVSTDNQKSDAKDSQDDLRHSQLRCWQYGKLIFEVTGWVASENKNNEMRLHKADNKSEQLYLTGMDNATCLYRN